jgi:hypothetical protein
MIGESIEIMRELDDPWGTASALDGLARVAVAQGDLEGAHALHREALSLANEIGDLLVVALSLEALAAAAARRGAPLRAARMWGAVEKLRETIGSAKSNREHARHEHDVEAARAACGDVEAFQRAWQEGRAGLQQVIEDER